MGDMDKWNRMKYDNIREFYNKSVVVPPFTIFEFIYRLLAKIICLPRIVAKKCGANGKEINPNYISKSIFYKRPMRLCKGKYTIGNEQI